eukprot:GHVP01024131.1.p1 GENE.GHVP01024131.1~~GHVP01024131.1.p1  ORF type:complete len:990 (+),score=174.53 GHVP01024131.1:3-2972(+)
MEKKDEMDYGLYSRQIYALGGDVMRKMKDASVLVVGLDGLGVEIAKNMILSGVGSVLLFDDKKCTVGDLESQYYITESDVSSQTRRDKACVQKLRELNDHVTTEIYYGSLKDLGNISMAIVTNTTFKEAIEINSSARNSNTMFIWASIRGLFGGIFCDFGKGFIIHDSDGEEYPDIVITGISNDIDGVVSCLDDSRHGLDVGDEVIFKGVNGMPDINKEVYRVISTTKHTFSIGDTRNLGPYIGGGLVKKSKKKVTVDFRPLEEVVCDPILVSVNYDQEKTNMIHNMFKAVSLFKEKTGGVPTYRDFDGFKWLFINEIENDSEFVESRLFEIFGKGEGELGPMASVIGGMVSQEAMKGCSGKFTPIREMFYFESIDSISGDIQEVDSESTQAKIFGHEIQRKIEELRVFVVGAGAIGCEALKNISTMSIGTKGRVSITDMDVIERSNLSRQFLFGPKDIGRSKSKTASLKIKGLNPRLDGRVVCYEEKIGQESEEIFTEEFFSSIDIVINGLDNVQARRYIDGRCVFHGKPLLESGTLGAKGNTQMIIPFISEPYSSSQDPPEKSIPVCTLRNFPNQIEHCIEWALDSFHGQFSDAVEFIKRYAEEDGYINKMRQSNGLSSSLLENVTRMVAPIPSSVGECIRIARGTFDQYFRDQIINLLHNFPADSLTTNGTPFWGGGKRVPREVEYNPECDVHAEFIYRSTLLYCEIFGISTAGVSKRIASAEAVRYATERLRFYKKVRQTSLEGEQEEGEDDTMIDGMLTNLPSREEVCEQLKGKENSVVGLKEIEFEKDDDLNGHVDYVTSVSNLRAINYGLEETERENVRRIAGRIIPALATTTSIVSGLVFLELYKIVQGEKRIERYRNYFINLSLSYLGYSEPIGPEKMVYKGKTVTEWDRILVEGDRTLSEIIQWFIDHESVELTVIEYNGFLLYNGFVPNKRRLEMKISEVIGEVAKENPLKKMVIQLCVIGNGLNGDEVDIPMVKMIL